MASIIGFFFAFFIVVPLMTVLFEYFINAPIQDKLDKMTGGDKVKGYRKWNDR